jgi:tryptophanyl-tRNA synthetase
VRSGKREKVFLNYSLLYQKKIVPSQPKSETEQEMGKIILTGDRPTGKLHLGHYIGSLRRRVELQEAGNYDKMFVFMADVQALTDNADNPEKIRQNIIEVALDYLSAGLDPEKCVLFIQSQITELAELTTYLMNLVSVSRVQRNPTVKTEVKMRGFEGESIPLGFFCYPVSQAADITLFKATTVPAGEDQEPMLEVTRELVRRFNQVYAPVLVEPNIMLPENATARRLPGTDGKEKMSKSLGNCIYLSDDADTVWQKVRSMYTDPEHINLNDPGHVEGNAVFTYLDAFSKQEDFANFLPEYQNLDELKDHYRRGGLGDMKCKKFLNQILNEMLEPIRQRRHEFEQDIPEIYNILKKGTEKARETAAQTMSEVRAAMRINYFDDEELIQSQAERFRAK